MFNRTEPWHTNGNMFILFDYAHLIKNVQNNWIAKTF